MGTGVDRDVTARRFLSVVAAASAVWATARAWSFDIDDGEIVDRYVENLLSGHGWVFNPGDLLNACTSTLHPFLVTVMAFALPTARDASHVVGGLALAVAGASAARLFWSLRSPLSALAASVLVPLSFPLADTWGLETQLLIALLLLGATTRTGRVGWALRSLASLTRPDVGVWIPVSFVRQRLMSGQWPWRAATIALVPILATAIVSLAFYGSLTPNSFANKLGQGHAARFAAYSYLSNMHGALLSVLPTPATSRGAWLLAACGLALALRQRAAPLLELTLVVVTDQAVFIVMGFPGYSWYYAPLQVLILLLALHGTAELLTRTGRAVDQLTVSRIGRAAATATALVLMAAVVQQQAAAYPHRLGGREQDYVDLARDLQSHPPSTLAAAEVGVIGLHLPHTRIVDLAGLVSHPVYYEGRHNDVFFAHPPDAVVILFPVTRLTAEHAIYSDPRFARDYVESRTYANPGFSVVHLFRRSPQG